MCRGRGCLLFPSRDWQWDANGSDDQHNDDHEGDDYQPTVYIEISVHRHFSKAVFAVRFRLREVKVVFCELKERRIEDGKRSLLCPLEA